MLTTEERVDRLETLFGQFMTQTSASIARIDGSIARIDASAARIDETAARLERTVERLELNAEQDRREYNKRWGELAVRLGTLVEDIIAPSLRRMAQEVFDCGEIEYFAVRPFKVRPDDPSKRREFDTIAVGAKAVLLNQSKTTVRAEDVRDFAEFVESGEFFTYFPEYKGKPLIPIFSSLYLPDDVVTYLTRQGIYAVAMSDEAMQVLNLEQVRRGRPPERAPR